MSKDGVIPCSLLPETKEAIETYARELRVLAPTLGSHGLSEDEFWDAGIFHSAIERLRGIQAASTDRKRRFLENVLEFLKTKKFIKDWAFSGGGERHDYAVTMPKDRLAIIEAKGCLDGNNTNIYVRPPNADEFIIWSLCQNPGANPKHNVWSGIHTRLGAEIIHRPDRVDGLIIWDMLCGTSGRPCPKLKENPAREIALGKRKVPPPCLYLFPHSRPEPRNNPAPAPWKLEEVTFLHALYKAFGCDKHDVAFVKVEARREGADLQRKTTIIRNKDVVCESEWNALRRANP
jgi:hypothetical protein